MKLKYVAALLLLLWGVKLTAGPIPFAEYRLDNNGGNSVKGEPAKISNGKPAKDRSGKPNGALFFSGQENRNSSTPGRQIVYPLAISPDQKPQLTVTMWLRVENCLQKMQVLVNGKSELSRGLVIAKNGDEHCLALNCGKDGMLFGPAISSEWIFVAMLYDQSNEAARLVVNGQVYSSAAIFENGEKVTFTSRYNGAIDDVKFFNKVLNKDEIESISGISITVNSDDLNIKKRFDYRKANADYEENHIKNGDIFIVDAKELGVKDESNKKVIAVLTTNDTVMVTGKNKKSKKKMYQVVFKGGQTGYLEQSDIEQYTYPPDSSPFIQKAIFKAKHLFNLGQKDSWIIFGIFFLVLFLFLRYIRQIDDLLIKLNNGLRGIGRRNSQVISVPEDGEPNRTDTSFIEKPPAKICAFLATFYPRTFRPYPLFIGIILGIGGMIALMWNAGELFWYVMDGFSLWPTGYNRPIHWYLYGLTTLSFLLLLSNVVESFYLAGPVFGWVRIGLFAVLNVMTFVVSYFLFFVVAAILAIILALVIVGGVLSSMGDTREVVVVKKKGWW